MTKKISKIKASHVPSHVYHTQKLENDPAYKEYKKELGEATSVFKAGILEETEKLETLMNMGITSISEQAFIDHYPHDNTVTIDTVDVYDKFNPPISQSFTDALNILGPKPTEPVGQSLSWSERAELRKQFVKQNPPVKPKIFILNELWIKFLHKFIKWKQKEYPKIKYSLKRRIRAIFGKELY